MAIGMSYDEFWFKDCQRAKYYRKAYELKQDQLNEQLWLQGVYIYEALIDVSPILHAFSNKAKPIPYPKRPYSFSKREKEAEEKQKNKIYTEKENANERLRAEMFFKNWARATAKQFNGK